LLIAAVNGHEACVRALIAAKANLAIATSQGETALHLAASNGHASTCQLLVDEDAPLTTVDRNRKTAYELAKARGRADCAGVLNLAGAVLPPAEEKAYKELEDNYHFSRTGYRFKITKAADSEAEEEEEEEDEEEEEVAQKLYAAAEKGDLVKLLDLCKTWAGHSIIDFVDEDEEVSFRLFVFQTNYVRLYYPCHFHYTRTHTHTYTNTHTHTHKHMHTHTHFYKHTRTE